MWVNACFGCADQRGVGSAGADADADSGAGDDGTGERVEYESGSQGGKRVAKKLRKTLEAIHGVDATSDWDNTCLCLDEE